MSFWQREFDPKELAFGVAVLLPSLLLFLFSGAELWFQCAWMVLHVPILVA